MSVQITDEGGAWHVESNCYRLVVEKDSPRARLCDLAGMLWSELSLLASVHRSDTADETLGHVTGELTATDEVVTFEFRQRTGAWEKKVVVLEARADAVHMYVELEGAGSIDTVVLCGGDAVASSGACGRFHSSMGFRSIFSPGPTEPIQVVRSASSSARLGVVGDAEPGRLHGIFSPPPLTFVVSHAPAPSGPGAATAIPQGEWLGVGVLCDVGEASFTHVTYQPLDGGWHLQLAYEGHTRVGGRWKSPVVRMVPAPSPWTAIADHRDQVVAGWPVDRSRVTSEVPAWWLEPIFCGWGCQCARSVSANASPDPGLVGGAAVVRAPSLSTAENYDGWLATLAAAGAVPGTVVIDDRWQSEYGTCEVDTSAWPDMRGWIDARHAVGQRVLLWFKAWDPAGLPAQECIRDALGNAVAADPTSEAYVARLVRMVHYMLSPEGLDADGFKVDFTQRAPSGRSLVCEGDGRPGGGTWGISMLHSLMSTLHAAAKETKPDALVVTHCVHPGFEDVTDMVRLNDILEKDQNGERVDVVDQLRFRAAVAQCAMPCVPIDTDQWPIPDREQWLAYVGEQPLHGVPAVYYVESIDGSGEELEEGDLRRVAHTWKQYRERDYVPSDGQAMSP